MSITSAAVRKAGPYQCDGIVVAFPFNFKVFSSADVLVVLTDLNGVESNLTTGYAVTVNANQDSNPGGTVTMVAPPIAGYLITLGSQVANTQPMVLTNNGGFFATVLNDMADRCVMLVQQLSELSARSLTLPFSVSSSVSAKLSAPVPNSVLCWDALGRNIITAVMQTGTSLIDLAASAGSSLIGFVQFGAAAVRRTVQDKLRERVCIADFYTGSGTYNAALNAAAAALPNGGEIFFPAGNYNFGTSFTLTATNITLTGTGRASYITHSGQFSVSGSSGCVIEKLGIENTNSASQTYAIFIGNGGKDITIRNCYIKSTGGLVMVNDSGLATTTTNVLVENNIMETVSGVNATGCRTRISLDGVRDVGAVFRRNVITLNTTKTGGEVGIESWSDGTLIAENTITAPNLNGGFGGIVIGGARSARVINNRVRGFSAGIELGNDDWGDIVVTGNHIGGSKYGVYVTSGGSEQAITISGNIVVLDDAIRTDYVAAYATVARQTNFVGNAAVHIDSSPAPSWPQVKNGATSTKSYLNSFSRRYTAFYGDTSISQTNISGNSIVNFNIGVQMSASAFANIFNNVSGNVFENVRVPVNDVGGSPFNKFTGNLVHNFDALIANKYLDATGNTFSREADYPLSSGAAVATAPYAQAYLAGTTYPALSNIGNTFVNCFDNTMVADISFAIQGAGYGRPVLEFRGYDVLVSSGTDWPTVKAQFASAGRAVPYDVLISSWPNGKRFVKRIAVQNADITDGTDKINNWN